jgi:hypothetical protein
MKALVRISLAFLFSTFVCASASADPISSSDAHAQCANWTHDMASGTSHCGVCVYLPLVKPRCTFYVCDAAGCDTVTVERRRPRRHWTIRPTMVGPR